MSAAVRIYDPDWFDWSTEQLRALDRINRWRSCRTHPYMTLGGYAGTGKTTLISYLAGQWTNAAVCAFTGKAASVLRRKGVARASTIHGLIYAPFEDEYGKIRFTKRSEIKENAIIVDEASMVGKRLHEDLMSFGAPILYVGDHGQLEPVGDARDGMHLMADPHVRLETIHRQAADNPILRVASAFREGRENQVWEAMQNGWKDRQGRVLIGKKYDAKKLMAGQAICGINKTRHAFNDHIRRTKGFRDPLPMVGETVICLQNNQEYQVFNGQQFEVVGVGRDGDAFLDISVQGEDGRRMTLACLTEQFGRNKIEDFRDPKVVLFDYGYCLTAHKAQGSEWPEVTVIEEGCGLWDDRRWRYTAATRAVERLVYCV